MNELLISDFEELEFNLDSIGLNDLVLSIEEHLCYISGNNLYIEIPQKNVDKIVKIKQGETIVVANDDGDALELNQLQFDQISKILNSL